MDINRKEKRIWNLLDDIHFYDNKLEALLKVFAILISWGCGVNLGNISSKFFDNERIIATSLFLFSISLIMEFTGKLVREYRFIPKIVPGIVTIVSFIIMLGCLCIVCDHPLELLKIGMMYKFAYIPLFIISIDVFTQLLLEEGKKMEEKLRDINVEERNE